MMHSEAPLQTERDPTPLSGALDDGLFIGLACLCMYQGPMAETRVNTYCSPFCHADARRHPAIEQPKYNCLPKKYAR
jgi:hypothetical protein